MKQKTDVQSKLVYNSRSCCNISCHNRYCYLLIIMVFLISCSAKRNDIGMDVYNELNISQYTIEETDGVIEKNYDARTLLRRGEAYFERKLYVEARNEYDRFLDLHPYHKYIPHVYYRIATSYLREFKSIDRNPAPLDKALISFTKLVDRYPESKYAADAAVKMKAIKEKLALVEFNTGRFYYKRGSFKAAIYRFKNVLNGAPSHTLKEKSLYYLALSLYKTGDKSAGGEYSKKLYAEFPDSIFNRQLKTELGVK